MIQVPRPVHREQGGATSHQLPGPINALRYVPVGGGDPVADRLAQDAPLFAMVHDASYYYAPEDNWEFHVKHNQEVSENLPFETLGWSPALKFTVESKVGRNLGQLIAPDKFHP